MLNISLRILEDFNSSTYEHSIKVLNKQSVELLESPPTTIDGFLKKDKILYSPSSKISSQQAEDPKLFPVKIFSFDSITCSDLPVLDTSKSSVLISVGKSDTLTSKSGLICQAISASLQDAWSVQIQISQLTQGKLATYLPPCPVSSLSDLDSKTNIDYLTLSDKTRDSLFVTWVRLEKNFNKKIFVFFDLGQISRFSEVFLNFFANKDNYEKVAGEDYVFEILASALSYSPKVLVVGNINPVAPHYCQTRAVLEYLAQVQEKRTALAQTLPRTLMAELKRLNFRNHELEKTLESKEEVIQKMRQDQKVTDLENSSLKDKICSFSRDHEIEQMMNQINLFHEKYLIKQAELAELEDKLNELTDLKAIRQEGMEKRPSVKRDPLAMELDFNKNKVSQDFGTSPIKSFGLTERTALMRIEEMTKELDQAKSSLRSLKDKEELLHFEVPSETLDHYSYYQVISTLFKAVQLLRGYYDDKLNSEYNRVASIVSLYENRQQFMKQKLFNLHKAHVEKLKVIQGNELELSRNKDELASLKKEVLQVKETYAEFQFEVQVFKEKCKEKMNKAKADTDVREELRRKEAEVEGLAEEINQVKSEMLVAKQREVRELAARFNEDLTKLRDENEMLKSMVKSRSK